MNTPTRKPNERGSRLLLAYMYSWAIFTMGARIWLKLVKINRPMEAATVITFMYFCLTFPALIDENKCIWRYARISQGIFLSLLLFLALEIIFDMPLPLDKYILSGFCGFGFIVGLVELVLNRDAINNIK